VEYVKSISPILIVDDDEFFLKIAAITLANLGFVDVHYANSVGAAIDILERHKPPIEVIMLDLNMPDVDGIELLRELTSRQFNGGIILISGEDERTLSLAESLARARQLRVLGSLSKPFKADTLRALFDQWHSPKTNNQDISSKAPANNITEEQLRAAIEGKVLEPWFQPKIDIRTGQAVGVELLARWPTQQGNIYPDAFIPLAESTRLVDAMTFMLLSKAMRWVNQWQRAGVDFNLAINISMDSLYDLTFPEKLLEIISGTDIALIIEVTESRVMKDLVAPLDNLLRLRLKKIGLSIDDFGTGGSNLAQLRDLPFTELKLDISFVQRATTSLRDHNVLQHTIELAKDFGLTTVAEGVEEKEHWDLVTSMGCDVAQGIFLARPMPGEKVEQWANTWRLQQQVTHTQETEAQPFNIKIPTTHAVNTMPNIVDDEFENLSILLVEDDPFMQRAIEQALSNIGLENVTKAGNGREALDILSNHDIQLILTDVQMPIMNGLQLLQQVRCGNTKADRKLRTVVISALTDAQTLGMAIGLDVNGFLTKPFKPVTVIRTIMQALSEEEIEIRSKSEYLAITTDLGLPIVSLGLDVPPMELGLKTKSKAVSIHKLRPGMLLTRDVISKTGQLLLSAGFILNERTIPRLYDLKDVIADDGFYVGA
jgi:EAL domain-containing protein (putative c-di-GMP-specific phosphodiesterase class I)/response regulator of citrate/malate metabolism